MGAKEIPERPNSESIGTVRKLAAILFADVRGYSRLISEDETATVEALQHHFHNLIAPTVANCNGRVVRTMGDGLFVEFPSAVDAVRCGVDIQRAMAARNVDVPEIRRIEFRIGINLGDVIVNGHDLHGEGVNIAARLEQLAEAGSVCISRTVYEQVRDKLPLEYEYGGEQTLKNIPEPVEVYWIWPEKPGAQAVRSYSRKPKKLSLPARPSIAVLPITNMSSEEDLRYLCDGMTEGIIANLSRFRELFVIARHSSFAYRDKQMPVTEIAKELGVRYLLEGSILKIGEKIRMIAQLIDATTSYHVWANNYDRHIQEIPQIHDEVTQLIVSTLPLRLEEAEKIRMRSVETEDLDAFGYLLRGQEVFLEYTRSGHAKALKLFEKAIECDPNYARAYAAMSRVYNHENRYSWTDTPELTLKKALEFAHKAIQLDPADARGYSELGIVHLYMKNADLAIAHFEKALSLNPNDADIIAELADAHVYAGRPETGLELLNTAMRLNPYTPDAYLWKLADAYFVLRDYRAVIKTAQGMQNPSEADRLVAASYAHLGEMEKARTHASEVLRKHPEFTVYAWAKNQPDTDPAEVEHLSEGLRKAGLPE